MSERAVNRGCLHAAFVGLVVGLGGCSGQAAVQAGSSEAPAQVEVVDAAAVQVDRDRQAAERSCRHLAAIHEFERCHFLAGPAIAGFDVHSCTRETTQVLRAASAEHRAAYDEFFDCVADSAACDQLEACYQALLTATVGPVEPVPDDDMDDEE